MICVYCNHDAAIWTGPLSAVTGTHCENCGAVDCVAPGTTDRDPELCFVCGIAGEPDGCTCSTHPMPPCGACENGQLKCPKCGEVWCSNG